MRAERQVLRDIAPPPAPSPIDRGSVTAVDLVAKRITVLVAETPIPGLRYLKSYTPVVGDDVVIYKNDGDWWVLGAFA